MKKTRKNFFSVLKCRFECGLCKRKNCPARNHPDQVVTTLDHRNISCPKKREKILLK